MYYPSKQPFVLLEERLKSPYLCLWLSALLFSALSLSELVSLQCWGWIDEVKEAGLGTAPPLGSQLVTVTEREREGERGRG